MKKNFFVVLFSFVLVFFGIYCASNVEASEFSTNNVWEYLLNNNSYTVKSGEGKYDCDQQTQNSCNYDFNYEYQLQFSNPSIGGTYLFYGVSKPVDIEYYDLKGSYPAINDRFVVEKYQFNGEFSRVSSHIQANSNGTFTIQEEGIYKIYTGEVSFHQTIYLIYETDFISMKIENVEFKNDYPNPSLAARVIIENPKDINTSSSNVVFHINEETLPVHYINQVPTGTNNSYVVTVMASLSGVTNKVVSSGLVTISVHNNTRQYSNVSYDIETPKLAKITYFNSELANDEFGVAYNDGITLNNNPNGFIVKLNISESSDVSSVLMNGISCNINQDEKSATCNITPSMYQNIMISGLLYQVRDEFNNYTEINHDIITFESNSLENIEIETDALGYIKVKGSDSNIDEICLFYGEEDWLSIQKFECGEKQVKSSYTYTGDVQVVLFNKNLLYKAILLEDVKLSNDKIYLGTPVSVTINNLQDDDFSILDAVNELPKVACGLADNECQQQGSWQIVYKRHTQDESPVLLVEEFEQINGTTIHLLELLNNKIRSSESSYEQFDLEVIVVFNYTVGGIAQSVSKQHVIKDELPTIATQSLGAVNLENVFIEYGDFGSSLSSLREDLYENETYILVNNYGSAKIVSRIVSYIDLDSNVTVVNHEGLLPHEYLQQNLNLGQYVLECMIEISQGSQPALYSKSFFIKIFVKDSIIPTLTPLANKLVEVKQYDVYKDSVPKCSDATGCRVKITYYFEGKQVEKIDTDKVGTYTIKYVAVDGSGNESFEEVKTVIIIGINALDTTSILIIAGIVIFFGGLVAVAIVIEFKKNKKQKNIK